MSSYGITKTYNNMYYQNGTGIFDMLRKVNQFAKDKQLLSRGIELSKKVGLDSKLNDLLGGNLDNLDSLAKTYGYGKKRYKKGAGRSRKPGRPRK